ncbi:hypothetical protein [Breznakia pachnodae]|uniref:Uncharacterized protein n=1 Tax=Breznakia pachnodae TaxID=265178 RepID=A0ABU0DXT2_9FIRM|nr:hypothetical protein [Breznakia pachnodae]MDQ0359448.1 hypothetical protein [Breznakia pachnodae]
MSKYNIDLKGIDIVEEYKESISSGFNSLIDPALRNEHGMELKAWNYNGVTLLNVEHHSELQGKPFNGVLIFDKSTFFSECKSFEKKKEVTHTYGGEVKGFRIGAYASYKVTPQGSETFENIVKNAFVNVECYLYDYFNDQIIPYTKEINFTESQYFKSFLSKVENQDVLFIEDLSQSDYKLLKKHIRDRFVFEKTGQSITRTFFNKYSGFSSIDYNYKLIAGVIDGYPTNEIEMLEKKREEHKEIKNNIENEKRKKTQLSNEMNKRIEDEERRKIEIQESRESNYYNRLLERFKNREVEIEEINSHILELQHSITMVEEVYCAVTDFFIGNLDKSKGVKNDNIERLYEPMKLDYQKRFSTFIIETIKKYESYINLGDDYLSLDSYGVRFDSSSRKYLIKLKIGNGIEPMFGNVKDRYWEFTGVNVIRLNVYIKASNKHDIDNIQLNHIVNNFKREFSDETIARTGMNIYSNDVIKIHDRFNHMKEEYVEPQTSLGLNKFDKSEAMRILLFEISLDLKSIKDTNERNKEFISYIIDEFIDE